MNQTPLKPLLDAGEFSTIAEDMDTGDREFREVRLQDFFEKTADKIPGIGQTAIKNLLITCWIGRSAPQHRARPQQCLG